PHPPAEDRFAASAAASLRQMGYHRAAAVDRNYLIGVVPRRLAGVRGGGFYRPLPGGNRANFTGLPDAAELRVGGTALPDVPPAGQAQFRPSCRGRGAARTGTGLLA